VAHEPDARERGVRMEIRPARWRPAGSIYASPALQLEPAVVRVDLLESSPHAADRMHWHPVMRDGEPEDRVFDGALKDDPRRWLTGLLSRTSAGAVDGLSPDVASSLRGDGPAIAAAETDILDCVMSTLERSRRPWPHVSHDERGMATA
jgi:hypothetical protein